MKLDTEKRRKEKKKAAARTQRATQNSGASSFGFALTRLNMQTFIQFSSIKLPPLLCAKVLLAKIGFYVVFLQIQRTKQQHQQQRLHHAFQVIITILGQLKSKDVKQS